MHDRRQKLLDFISGHGGDVASLRMIAGDASNRAYYRVLQGSRSVVVMDAPPEKGEDIRPFVQISQWLRGIGLSAPDVLAQETGSGFLLLEDLGDDLFARLLERGAVSEAELYRVAADVLTHIHQAPAPQLPVYDAATMSELGALAVTWYRKGATGEDTPDLEARFRNDLRATLQPLDRGPHVLIQRDYHAENLLWLPERSGAARVGLLDFQDAMLGHPAYDLVSVLQDARRDVSPEVQAQMLDRMAGQAQDPSAFLRAYHVLGLQRNLRILGVFARLCLRDGKAGYIDLIPRVWGHIVRSLDHLEDADLQRLVEASLPAPDADVLSRLKGQSA